MRSLIQRTLPLCLILTQWELFPWFLQRARENEDTAVLHTVLALGLLSWWWPKRKSDYCHPHFQVLALLGCGICALLSIIDCYPLIRMFAFSATFAATLLMRIPQAWSYSVSLGFTCCLLPFSEETAAFLFGYPARILATRLAGAFLHLSGFSISHEGAVMFINEQPLFADAPCAGLMMGWTGFAIASLIALYHQLSPKRSLLLFCITPLLILVGNSFRMIMLAQLEQLPPFEINAAFLHNAIGIFSFILLLPLLLWAGRKQPQAQNAQPTHAFYSTWPVVITLMTLMPLLPTQEPAVSITTPRKVEWPNTWQGQSLSPIADSELDKIFAKNFPGEMARFHSGTQNILFRQLAVPSRQLHASLQCYRANGYRVIPRPALQDNTGNLWSSYEAIKGDQQLQVKEQIQSLSSHKTWPDVSAWYWDAITGKDAGPWLAVTVAE